MAEPRQHEAPPVGEEIHLPEPTLMPLVLAAGITLVLLGLTINYIFTVAGGAITVVTIVRWIRLARRELGELPPEHH